MAPISFRRAILAALLTPSLLCLTPAHSQPVSTPSKPAPPGPAPISTALSEEPFRLDSVGLTMRLPTGSTAQAIKVGQQTTVQIAPDDRSWSINIQTPKTTDPNATVSDAAERTMKQFIEMAPIKDAKTGQTIATRAQVLSRVNNLKIPGAASVAERFYVSIPTADGSRMVQGYTIFKPMPDQYVVFELVTQEQNLNKARALYELTVATATFQDPSAIETSRRNAVMAGVAFLQRLTPEDYVKAMHSDQRWYRLYRPARTASSNDAEEIGYRAVKFWKGRKSDIPGLTSSDDNPEGILTEVSARILDRHPITGAVRTIDTVATYFQTIDRREEAWSVRNAVRDPRQRDPLLWSESGFRKDKDMRVAINQSRQDAKQVAPVIQGDGYITQLEVFLLPRLVIPMNLESELGFYAYRSDSESVSLRRETFSKDPSAGGAWTVQTKFREEAEPQRAVYRENGDLVHAETADGKVWEPIAPDELMRIWKNKGLPVGPSPSAPGRGR